MWKCPECEHKIDNLNYRVDTSSSEYGSASLSHRREGTNRDRVDGYDSDDYGDNEWVGTPDYTCPECDNEIELADLIWIENEDDEEEEKPKVKVEPEPEETLHKIIRPERDILKVNPVRADGDSIVCKNCSHIFVIEETYRGSFDRDNQDEELFECPKCGISNSLNEYKKLLLNSES